MKRTILFIFLLVLIGSVLIFYQYKKKDKRKINFIAEVLYRCNDNKQILARYYERTKVSVKEGERPTPSGQVELVLGDGRKMALVQTISASGIRYASGDESIIFWSKGSTAFLMENNTETFSNCIENASS